MSLFQITHTMYQAPNTVIYDCLPIHRENGHHKEIVIGECYGYRVVWCVTVIPVYNCETFNVERGYQTRLYRLEAMRQWESEYLPGNYVVYDPVKVVYTHVEAMSWLEFMRQGEKRLTPLEKALQKELDTIQFFYQHIYNYCSECALKELFGGSVVRMLHSLRSNQFTDVSGFGYGLYHEFSASFADTPSYDQGVNCSECGATLLEPLEDYDEDLDDSEVLDEDETVTGWIAGDSLDNGDHDTSLPSDFDSQSF